MISDLEAEFAVVTTTGTKLKYKLKRKDGIVSVSRIVTLDDGSTNTTDTSIKDIKTDGNQMLHIANSCEKLLNPLL